MRLLRLCTVLFVFAFPLSSYSQSLTVEDFAQLPDVQNVKLSPNGEKILSIVRVNLGETQGTAVQVTDLKTDKSDIMLFSENKKHHISKAFWKDNTTILATSWFPSKRDTWLGYGRYRAKTREHRLSIINTKTGKITAPFKNKYLKRYKVLPSNLANIIDHLPNDPNHILMSIPGVAPHGFDYPVVVKININNQKIKTIQTPEDKTLYWFTDNNHKIRGRLEQHNETIRIKVKDLKSKKWKELWTYDIFSKDEINLLGFGANPNILYFSAYDDEYKAIFKTDTSKAVLERTLIHKNPKYDVSGKLIYSTNHDEILGVGTDADGGTVFIDPTFKSLQTSINKALPKTRNFISSISEKRDKFIVFSTGHKESGTYYLGTLNPLRIKALAYSYKKLTPKLLANVKRMDYKARDGMPIEAYLTLPQNSDEKNLPTIMFPHGGPATRDSKAFDYWAQFFAHRGYAVLQMNFRGSAGQGYSFFSSGFKKWGKEMQDDIEDGAIELINKGIADPNKIGIVGASYGGYASLMGIAKTPSRYKCAISINGVSNVYDLVKDNRRFWKGYNAIDEYIGNNNKKLKEISPVNYADTIQAPVLLIHGELDRQVDIKHSYQMRDALMKAGKKVTFVEQPLEDHYLSNEKMRIQAFKEMDRFLQKYLPTQKANNDKNITAR